MSVTTCGWCGEPVHRLTHLTKGTTILIDIAPTREGYVAINEHRGTYVGIGRHNLKHTTDPLYLPHIVTCKNRPISPVNRTKGTK